MDALIKSFSKSISTKKMEKIWKRYLEKRSFTYSLFNQNPPVLVGELGALNLKRYKGLSRAQSTILLHCRTGIIGLNATLHHRHLSNTYNCPCGDPRAVHDAEHLFMRCKRLDASRKHLKNAVPVFTFHALVTHHTNIASAFAIRHFGIKQFDWTAKYMPNSSFGNLEERGWGGQGLQTSTSGLNSGTCS
ncbi:hypothetical protein LY76DRAFT_368964 [Colletotrichum caudatum]|nr:hypothetical protein LY76DRAFT_368964 [Colletotrichum caudatum]